MPLFPAEWMPALVALSQEAGRAVMAVYARGDVLAHRLKADASPVTEADLAAERVIQEGLARHLPGVPVRSEEAADGSAHWGDAAGYFLVDPLDGTREFLARNGEFTVNIAWVVDGQPLAGVVHAPALGETFWGHRGGGAFRQGTGRAAQPMRTAPAPPPGATWQVFGSRSHRGASTDAWLAGLPAPVALLEAGSSMKFCRLAEGRGHLYPRFGPTHHWDTAAGQAVLEAAGGVVLDASGQALRYPPAAGATLNPSFVALAQASLWEQLPPFPS